MQNKLWIVGAILLVLVLSGCTALSQAAEPTYGEAQPLVERAIQDLAARLHIAPEQIEVQSVSSAAFADTSLGVPEPGQMYATVITSGYYITLRVGEVVYEYHGSGNRVVLTPTPPQSQHGAITIERVNVLPGQRIIFSGGSTLPEGSCLHSELLAGNARASWWPVRQCVPVEQGAWQLVVRLGEGDAPAELDADTSYTLRVWHGNEPDTVSAPFVFDLGGPQAAP